MAPPCEKAAQVTPFEKREYLRQRNGGEFDHVHDEHKRTFNYYKQSITTASVLVCEYFYRDEGGAVVAKKRRFDPKAFAWMRLEDGQWVPGKPEKWFLYRLPELMAAAPHAPVLFCEGEKDADNVAALGLVSTTAPGPWSDTYAPYLKGKTVFLLKDNDEHGDRQATKAARSLAAVGAVVHLVDFSDQGEKGDVSDYIAGGAGKDELLARCQAAPRFQDTAIEMRAGALVQIVDQAQAGLIKAGAPIYQRGGELVRPIQVDMVNTDGPIRRAVGSTILTPVKRAWLLEQMARHLEWTITKKGKGVVADPNPKYAETMLARSGEWPFSVLTGLANAPTLDQDGRAIAQSGYDSRTGLLLVFEPGTFPPVPDAPTQNDAKAALGLFVHLLRGFPFAGPPDLSVALSAFLTALVRPSLGTAPLHGFDAPQAGTGKSLLVEMVGLVLTGSTPPAMAQGKSPEEDEKRLGAVMMAGDGLIWLDNVEKPIEGDLLCSMLTQKSVGVRPLGVSERRILPCTALVCATGNNLTLSGDATRRSVICRLDAGEERPDEREFAWDAKQEVMADRPGLVVAGLTALRAYKLAGSPEKLKPFGSFPDYDWVRGTLKWCGYADPAETRDAILSADPHKSELAEVMTYWSAAFGEGFRTVADIPTTGTNMGGPQLDLEKALKNATNTNAWSGKSVGRWLLRHKDRVVGGFAFRQGAGRSWKLEKLKKDTQT
jgi:hypothetical protein